MTPTKPIILSKDELRAALDGTLTEVRRKVKANLPPFNTVITGEDKSMIFCLRNQAAMDFPRGEADWLRVPITYPTGTRLWVKETWGWSPFASMPVGPNYPQMVVYKADGPDDVNRDDWRRSTTMPAWASRLTLTVESVAVSNDGGTWWWVYGVVLERKDAR